MTRICLSSLLLFCLTGIYGQSPVQMVEDSSYHFKWDAEEETWLNNYKIINVYDLLKDTCNRFTYTWEAGAWIRSDRWQIKLDHNLNPVKELILSWYRKAGEWENSTCQVTVYDQAGRMVSQALHMWNRLDQRWEGWKKFVTVLDTAGNYVADVVYHWNNPTMDWVGEQKIYRTYDGEGRELAEDWYVYRGDPGGWMIVNSYVHKHDSLGRIVESLGYDRFPDSTAWEKSSLSFFSYDSAGNWVDQRYYRWSDDSGGWYADFRQSWEYSDRGLVTAHLLYGWEPADSSWSLGSKSIKAWDESGNMILHEYHSRWPGETVVKPRRRYEYTFNPESYLTEEIRYDWDPETADWKYYSKVVRYWSEFDVTDPVKTLDRQRIESIRVFPNPFTDQLTVEFHRRQEVSRIELFDVQGRKLRSYKHINKPVHVIRRGDLPPGIYLLRISGHSGSTRRVIAR